MNRSIGNIINADDLTGGVDAPSRCIRRARKVQPREVRPHSQESVSHTVHVEVDASNVATRIDPVSLRENGLREGNIKAEALPVGANKPVCLRVQTSVPPSPEIATGIDTRDKRVYGTGEIYFRKSSILPRETMLFEQVAVSIEEIPRTDDCTGRIDSKG